MPIKWTPETDQILLLKILETCNVTANVKAISEAWPSDRERPTARAISERLFKIRNNTKNTSGTASLTVSNGDARKSSSPQKPKANGKGISTKGAAVKKSTTNGKRRRDAESDGDNISDGSELLAIKAEESPDTEVEGPKPKQPRTTKEMKAARDAKVAQFLATEAANPVNKKLPYKKTGKGGWAMNTEREVEDKGDAI